MKTPEEFVKELKEHFWNKNKSFLLNRRETESLLDTIKAYLQKKNLVIVSKVEYERLKNEN